MNAANGQQIAYEPNDDAPAWWRAAIDAMPWVPTEVDGVVLWYEKSGPCPRCQDDPAIRASLDAEGWVALGPEEDTDIFVRCRCTAEHGRPSGVPEGCGWGGYVAGPVTGARQ